MTAIQLRAELFRELNPLLDNEAAMEKILVYVRTIAQEKNTKVELATTGWADQFVGAWKDSRKAEKITKDICGSRTTNNFDV